MKGTRKRASIELGHDAFLDIVANLVGILIILVVILGTRSQQVAEQMKEEHRTTEAERTLVQRETEKTGAARQQSQQLERAIAQYDAELARRSRERAGLVDLLTVAREAWQKKQQEYDEATREAIARQAEENTLEATLEELRGQRDALAASEAPVVAVEHLPTPMAKTVFGEEIHFRLKGGLLSVVPIDRLIEAIRRDFSRVASGPDGLTQASVGPIQGYAAEYEMARSRQTVSRGGSVGMATRIQLVGLLVEPLQEPHGQPLPQVLAGNSLVDIELAGRDPATTTITVWVYPDSFAEFRKLKEYLYSRDFATAARPLPAGHPISGGPQGSRSNAQ